MGACYVSCVAAPTVLSFRGVHSTSPESITTGQGWFKGKASSNLRNHIGLWLWIRAKWRVPE
jgi:hypothetical protein